MIKINGVLFLFPTKLKLMSLTENVCDSLASFMTLFIVLSESLNRVHSACSFRLFCGKKREDACDLACYVNVISKMGLDSWPSPLCSNSILRLTASTELAAASPKMGPAWMRGGRDVTAAVGTSDDIRVIIQTYVRT